MFNGIWPSLSHKQEIELDSVCVCVCLFVCVCLCSSFLPSLRSIKETYNETDYIMLLFILFPENLDRPFPLHA
jgi:hypothetical protein